MVTNPPFSLFREYVAQLVAHQKRFLIIGHQNAITYKEIFPLIKDNKMWLGYGFNRNCAHFINKHYEDYASDADHKDGFIRVSGVQWYTNLDTTKRHEEIALYKKYTPNEFPQYDNYHVIEVSKVAEIPFDFDGAMGVPITFLNKYNPSQFDILWTSDRGGDGQIDYLKKPHDRFDAPVVNGTGIYKRILSNERRKMQILMKSISIEKVVSEYKDGGESGVCDRRTVVTL